MPHTKTGRCSVCGKPVHRGPTSRPEIICRGCRRKHGIPYGPRDGLAYRNPGYDPERRRAYRAKQSLGSSWTAEQRNCRTCKAEFIQERYGQKYCSEYCKNRRPRANPRDRTRDNPRLSTSRICEYCGQSYHPWRGSGGRTAKYCSWDCQKLGRRTVWPSARVYFATCSQCSKTFSSSRPRLTCSKDCQYTRNVQQIKERLSERYRTDSEFRDRVLAQAHARRADKLGLGGKQVLLGYLIKRDRGVCGLCHRPVRAKRGPMRSSIDHIIPLSKGGTHELENVQLAHYRCNLSKNDGGGGEQLLLIG